VSYTVTVTGYVSGDCRLTWSQEFIDTAKGVRKGVGVKTPLELDILQKLYYLRKEIKCFRILFAC